MRSANLAPASFRRLRGGLGEAGREGPKGGGEGREGRNEE